jgi:DNA-binding NarL/FixJ family response regulator
MTTVVICDDHEVVRQGLRRLLENASHMVVAEAANGPAGVEAVLAHRPRVLVTDMSLPGMTGVEVAREVRRQAPGTAIVVLSMYSDEGYVVEALRAGALAYVLKESSGAELVLAVAAAANGQRYLSATLAARAIDAYANASERGTSEDPVANLTPREREIFHLVANGLTSGQIAGRLSISTRTAETHRANLMKKLGVSSKAELLKLAIRKGFVPLT